jgi:hypothetical protein
MIDFLIVQAKIWLVGFIWENYWSFWKVLWAWSVSHPLQAPFVWFSMFAVTFAGYSTLRRMMEDGSLAALHWTQKATILSAFIIPGIHAYIFDILFMRVFIGTIFFRFKPWYQDWKLWTASWTFSRMIWLLKDRTPAGKWWHQLLHAIEPHGH